MSPPPDGVTAPAVELKPSAALPTTRVPPALRGAMRWALSGLVFVGVIGGWNAASGTLFHEVVLPPPGAVAGSVIRLLTDDAPFFLGEFQVTMLEIVLGFLIGTAVGLGLGLLLMALPLLRRMLYPYIVIYHSMPGVVLAPLIIAWFGFGPEAKVVQAVLGSFFPVFINTMVGLTLVDENGLRLMTSLLASRRQVFLLYRLPNALPAIFAGVRIGLTFAMIGAVVSEFLAAEGGVGRLIPLYQVQFRIDDMYAVILILGALGLGLFFFIEWVDRRVVFWRETTDRFR